MLITPKVTETSQLTIVKAGLNPGDGHNFHKHPRQEEVIYILSGTVEQWVDRDSHVLAAGDSAFIPAGMVHASFNIGKGDATLLAIFGPCVGDGFESVEVAADAPWNTMRG